jgi:cyanophycin synthetase
MPRPDGAGGPDPSSEIRLTALRALHGANYWSLRPVTRMDLAIGAYDDIPSSAVPALTETLVAALPGLMEHRCSIGQRGGFVTRLRRGTYAPHIIEHVALELQSMIGHDVGYGKTRGGDAPGEYTLIFEHRHSAVGLRAAALAMEVVQRAFAGTLTSVEHAIEELRSIASTADMPSMWQHVACGISGGGPRRETRDELLARGCRESDLIIDVAPSFILEAGLPYSRSEVAIILDSDLTDVPERYRDKDRARRLVSVLADVVWRDGVVVLPAREWDLQDYAHDRGCRVAVVAVDGGVTTRDELVAHSIGFVEDGHIALELGGSRIDGGPLRTGPPPAAQVAAALAASSLRELDPDLIAMHGTH